HRRDARAAHRGRARTRRRDPLLARRGLLRGPGLGVRRRRRRHPPRRGPRAPTRRPPRRSIASVTDREGAGDFYSAGEIALRESWTRRMAPHIAKVVREAVYLEE